MAVVTRAKSSSTNGGANGAMSSNPQDLASVVVARGTSSGKKKRRRPSSSSVNKEENTANTVYTRTTTTCSMYTKSRGKRSVHFAPCLHQTHLVETLATKYNKRILWHNPLELRRSRVRDLQLNLSHPEQVDNHNSNMELTWRGLEDCRPEKRRDGDSSCQDDDDEEDHLYSCQRAVTRLTHARMIVQEYWELVWNHNNKRPFGWDDQRMLGYLSEALSKEDREAAYQRGLQDEQEVQKIASFETSHRSNSGSMPTKDESGLSLFRGKEGLSMSLLVIFGLRPTLAFGNSSNNPVFFWIVGGYLLWMLQTMMVNIIKA